MQPAELVEKGPGTALLLNEGLISLLLLLCFILKQSCIKRLKRLLVDFFHMWTDAHPLASGATAPLAALKTGYLH